MRISKGYVRDPGGARSSPLGCCAAARGRVPGTAQAAGKNVLVRQCGAGPALLRTTRSLCLSTPPGPWLLAAAERATART